ncbi:unnamed protein product [Phyllotreta striolata]|uniref:AMP-dependent synthetase/ligase domain-containing protein n=1 Tax=Phyllotreta striolata TaxID=444603 RepID=A0A9N9TD72_PHYSR|nr:unnamed protein product [Phyllotreta striolata]
MLNTMSHLDTVHLLRLIPPKLMFISEESLEFMQGCLSKAGLKPELVVFGTSTKYPMFDQFILRHPEENEFRPEKIDHKELALILFSSGSTGFPKGICLSHYSIKIGGQNVGPMNITYKNPTVVLSYATFYWISTHILIHCCLINGYAFMVCKAFDPLDIWTIFKKYKITYTFLAPYNASACLNSKPQDADCSTLEIVLTGSAPVNKKLMDDLRTTFYNAKVLNVYGSTEAAGPISYFDPVIEEEYNLQLKYPTSSGLVRSVFMWKVVDVDTEEKLGPGKEGELRLKADHFMSGYYKMDSSTVYDSEGYVKTGDLVSYNESNCLFIKDRIKEMFKYKGWHILPAVLEEVLKTHPTVKEAVIIGAPCKNVNDGFDPMGVITLPMSHLDTVHLLRSIPPKLMFISEESLEFMQGCLSKAGLKPELVVFGTSTKYPTFDQFILRHPEENDFRPEKIDHKELALILFSSGSTGFPKGICLSHYTIKIGGQNVGPTNITYNNPTVALTFATFYWISTHILIHSCLINGYAFMVCKAFNPLDIWTIFKKYKVTYTFLAPYNCSACLNSKPLDADCSYLEVLITGSAPVNEKLMKDLRTTFYNAKVLHGYGSTETGGSVSYFDPLIEEEYNLQLKYPTSCGLVRNVDTEERLGPGEEGELRLKSDHLMTGYYKMDSSSVFDSEGYVKTGDLASYNESNCLFIKGRIKEMFKYKGWHILPAVLEEVLKTHPAVKDAVIIGAPCKNVNDGFDPMGYIPETNQTLTYSNLRTLSVQTALAIKAKGYKKGDIIATCTHNQKYSFLPVLASYYLGIINTNFDPAMSHLDTVHLLRSISPKLMFISEESLEFMQGCLSKAGLKPELVVFGTSTKYPTFDQFIIRHPEENEFRPEKIDHKEMALILFSSGSTGFPKGICLSHYTIKICGQNDGPTNITYKNPTVVLSFATFYWVSTHILIHRCLINGYAFMVCKAFNPLDIWTIFKKYKTLAEVDELKRKYIERAQQLSRTVQPFIIVCGKDADIKVTYTFLPPYNASACLNSKPLDADCSTLKLLITGSAPVNEKLMKDLRTTFYNAKILHGYGSTETGGSVSYFDPLIEEEYNLQLKYPTSCGLVRSVFLWKVVDVDTEERLGPGEEGELRLKSDHLMIGYYKMDSSSVFDSEGYVKTGDLASYNESNCLFIKGRIKEMFKYKCWHILPAVLEEVLKTHPAVQDAVIIGAPCKNVNDGFDPMGHVPETNETVTYSDLRTLSVRTALAIKAKGYKKGDIIATCTRNQKYSSLPVLASHYLGIINTNFDPSMSHLDTVHLLRLIPPKLMFISEEALEFMEGCLSKAGLKPELVVFGASTKYPTFDQFIVKHPEENDFRPEKIDHKELALVLFSSGSTGLPKGICLSHRTIKVGGGNVCAMNLTYKNPTVALIFASFYTEKKVTYTFLAPYNAAACLNSKPLDGDCSSLEVVLTGSAPVNDKLMSDLRTTFYNAKVLNVYSQTEVGTPVSCFDPLNDEECKLQIEYPTCCGKVLSSLQWKVVDVDTEEKLGPGKEGELRLKADHFMSGYYKMDSSSVYDSEGYLKTGDVASYNESNCLFVKDRIKEMFKYKGWHILPAVLEEVLKTHPAVKEAVIIGAPCKNVNDGFDPMGVITLRNGYHNVEHLRAGIRVVESIPKTATSKTKRRDVYKMIIETKS